VLETNLPAWTGAFEDGGADQRDCTLRIHREIGRKILAIIWRLASVGGTIFVDRGSRRDTVRVNREIEEALGDGVVVVLFPEETASGGLSVLPFRSSLLDPAIHMGCNRYPGVRQLSSARWVCFARHLLFGQYQFWFAPGEAFR
jgi:1-acyl-sn-glycerol-3-phosphate acyltransferase